MDIPAKFKKIDPVNQKYLADYLRYQELRNIQQTTIATKLWKVYTFLIWFGFRDAKTVRPEDLERFYLQRRKERSPITAFGDIQELRLFFAWLLPDRQIITFKPQKPRIDIPPEKVLAADNIREILKTCETQRDRALVMVFWDSGARLSELTACNVGHVKFDQYGAVVSVAGKTGRRNVRLVASVPDLQAWINIHPMKGNPDAPLFTTSRRRGTAIGRLNGRTVQNLFSRLGDLAVCPKDTNPHAFRHGRLTQRGRQLTESELREYAGWSKGSSMAAVYVHLSSRDIDNKILTVDGVRQEDEPARDPMAAIMCPRCRRANAPDAMYCSICSMALTDEAAKQVQIIERAALSEKTLREIVRDEMKKEK